MTDAASRPRFNFYPVATVVFVGILVVLAPVLTVLVFRAYPWHHPTFDDFVWLAVAGVILHTLNQLNFNIRFSGQKDNIELTFSEAGIVACFVRFLPGVVVLLSGLVHFIRELQSHRPKRINVFFNTSEIMVSVAVSGWVYQSLLGPANNQVVTAVAGAMFVQGVLNRLLVGTVVSLSCGGFKACYYQSLFIENIVMFIANLALAMTAVMAMLLNNDALLLVPFLILGVVYMGFQAYVGQLRDSNTLARLYENALLTSTESEAQLLPAALEKALDTFGTLEVALCIGRGEEMVEEWKLNRGDQRPLVERKQQCARSMRGASKPELLENDEPSLARPLRPGAQYTGMAAPVQYEGQLLGVLTARKPRSWDAFSHGDLRAFSLFARQLGVAIENARLQELDREQQRLRQKALDAERNRISRDLHDSFVQTLVQVDLHLEYLQKLMVKKPAEAPEELADLQHNVREGLREARDYMTELKPMRIAAGAFVVQVNRYLDEWGRQHRVATDLTAEWPDSYLTDDDLTELFQIIREALNNVAKHARAKHVEVRLGTGTFDVTMSVSDDGVGFDPNTMDQLRGAGHFGLANIAERASGLGGRVSWDSAPEHGTTLNVVVPHRPPALP